MCPTIAIEGDGDSRYICKDYILNSKKTPYAVYTLKDCYGCENVECCIKTNLREIEKEYFKNMECALCHYHVSFLYYVIVNKLKESGVLNKNFKPMCCGCFAKNYDFIADLFL